MADQDRPDLDRLYRSHLERLDRRYGAAVSSAGFDALVIDAGGLKSKQVFDDQDWPLCPTPAFAHWLALREPECALLLTPGGGRRLFRASDESFWEGRPEPESASQLESFDVVELPSARIGDELPRKERLAFVGERTERAASWGLDAGAINPPELLEQLDLVRAEKSDYERAAIAEANRRAARGHRRVFEAFSEGGRGELELHLIYLEATGQDDSETPYKNIVALGAHASTLHHVHYGREAPSSPTSLLLDAGATCLGYASDITRTEVRGEGEAAALFSELIHRVEALQQTVCSEIRTGMPYESLHDRAHQLMAPILRELGIARASDDELVERGVTRRFFPHGLGHSLGIQVHDVGCRPHEPTARNPYLRTTADVAAGHVFTIEPGCYFIGGLLEELRTDDAASLVDWDRVELLRPFGGVRIEDDVAVLDGGIANLTREAWRATAPGADPR